MPPAAGVRLRPLFAAVVIGAALLALLLVATGRALLDTRDAARRQAADSLGNLALSLERDISRSLEAYDALLRAVAQEGRAADTLDVLARHVLADDSGTAELFGAVLVTDAAGRVAHASRPQASEPDLSMHALFRAHREQAGQGLLVGEVEQGTRTGRPKVSLARRLGNPDGSFAGVVVGNVKLDYFNQVFSRFRLGPGGTVALLSLDGKLLANASTRLVGIGADLSGSAVMQRLRTEGAGTFEAMGSRDGVERLYAAQRLAGLPFWLVVGTSTEGVYADWTRRAWEMGAILLGFLLLLGGVAAALRRELQRRRQAEQNARASAADLKLVYDRLDDLVLKVDWDGTWRFVSPGSRQLLGREPSELLEGRALDFLHPDDLPVLLAARRELRAGTGGTVAAYRLRHRDGTWRHVEGRARALPDGSGFIVVVRDVTERISLEQKLLQAQRMEAVGQLTAGVAHDFNNMLQAQMAGLDLLLEEVRGHGEGGCFRPERATRHAEAALLASEHGAKLTHSLLAFSRKQVLRPEVVAVPPLLDRLTGLLSRTLDPRVVLRVEVEADLARPLVDPAQLEAALLNLCLNGRDAMLGGTAGGKGGRLLVEASGGAGVADPPPGLDPARCIVLAVSDEGCGMDAATLARACEPFFTTKGVGKGSGLGLSMVHGFVRQSGGELRVQSWPGKGTRIEIWLPQAGHGVPAAPSAAAPAAPAAAAPPVSAPACAPVALEADEAAADRPGTRVLLVDDEDAVRELVGEILEDAGFQVVAARSGGEALAALRAGQFGVLVTDYAMPGMTGGELVSLARRTRPDLPAVIITGYAEVAQLGEVPQGVMVAHKPFRADRLAALVRRLADAEEVCPEAA